jgi:outer membrane immunogenic protein
VDGQNKFFDGCASAATGAEIQSAKALWGFAYDQPDVRSSEWKTWFATWAATRRTVMRMITLAIAASAALLATPALAADMEVRAPAPPVPAWSWTGFYIGVQGGAGWGTTTLNENSYDICSTATPTICTFPQPGLLPANSAGSSYGISGWHGGGTAGVNWQNGPVVFGVEADISGSNINGSGDCTNAMLANQLGGVFPTTTSCKTTMTWFGTLTGRVGFVVDRALIYVKGGGAGAHFNYTTANIATGIPLGPGPVAALGENRGGGTAGFGIEYAFLNNWSAKLEYDYLDFGSRNLTFNGTPCLLSTAVTCVNNASVRETVSVVRAGVNYRFNWAGPDSR